MRRESESRSTIEVVDFNQHHYGRTGGAGNLHGVRTGIEIDYESGVLAAGIEREGSDRRGDSHDAGGRPVVVTRNHRGAAKYIELGIGEKATDAEVSQR